MAMKDAEERDSFQEYVICPSYPFWRVDIYEIRRYKDLVKMLVLRELVAQYKQTILGPVWVVVQPVLMSLVYVLVFSNIVGLSTDGIPHILFFLSGVSLWQFFADSVNRVGSTFFLNKDVFGKVFFPRIVVPLATLIAGALKLVVRLVLLIVLLLYYKYSGSNIVISCKMFGVVVPIFILMFVSLGVGLIVSSLTIKYRDLQVLFGFVVQLWMYLTPVVYPISMLGGKIGKTMIMLNPLTAIVEMFRYCLFSVGGVPISWQCYSLFISLFLAIVGIFVFNKVQGYCMDTI